MGTIAACTKAAHPAKPEAKIIHTDMPATDSLTYLALGDSYTIGAAVPLERSFPYQLVAQLRNTNHFFKKPEIIAVTGWTTDELIKGIAERDLKNKNYNIVTLLIGVNNQYRGYSKDVYRTEFTELLNTAINYAGGNRQHVFVLSIPDWGVTLFAQKMGRDAAPVGAEIDQFNAINKQETEKMGVAYVDITPSSRRAKNEAGLIADDGLHPSANMYNLWVSQLMPIVISQLK